MHRRAIFLGMLPAAFCLCLVSGCSKGDPRHAVTGRVLLKQQPLDEGIIDFEPLDGQGTQSGASILNGAYKIPRDKGLVVGRYRVTLIGGDGTITTGNAEPSGRLKPGVTPGKERIPPEYNLHSKIIVEVTEAGPNQFDFDIP